MYVAIDQSIRCSNSFVPRPLNDIYQSWTTMNRMSCNAMAGHGMAFHGGIDWGRDTPKDYTKPRRTKQSPNRQYKAPTDYTQT